MLAPEEFRAAKSSDDGLHRFFLSRSLRADLPGYAPRRLLFVMLNPSTADGIEDDPTIRRCRGFRDRWAFNVLGVVNLYSYRATSPADLRDAAEAGIDICPPENVEEVEAHLLLAHCAVMAWGANVEKLPRSPVMDLLERVHNDPEHPPWAHHLGLTKGGHPRHPLYVPNDTQPKAWTP